MIFKRPPSLKLGDKIAIIYPLGITYQILINLMGQSLLGITFANERKRANNSVICKVFFPRSPQTSPAATAGEANNVTQAVPA